MSGGIRPMELNPRNRKELHELIEDSFLYADAKWEKVAKAAVRAGKRLPSQEEWEVMQVVFRAEYLLTNLNHLNIESPYIGRRFEPEM